MEDFKPYEIEDSVNLNDQREAQSTLDNGENSENTQNHSKTASGDILSSYLSRESKTPPASPSTIIEDQLPSNLNLPPPDLIVKINRTEFHVHKHSLSGRSRVFADKFLAKPFLKKIEIKLITPEIFKIIRDFIYANKIPPKEFRVLEEVFKQSTMLKIEELRDLTSKLLIQILDFDNAMAIFQIGTDYNDEEMKKKAFEVVKKILPGQIEKEEQMSDLLILKELVRAKYIRKRKFDDEMG